MTNQSELDQMEADRAEDQAKADRAFDKAIERGVLSLDENAYLYVHNWMYMSDTAGVYAFKHQETRTYIHWDSIRNVVANK
jgi:hypothetical protein